MYLFLVIPILFYFLRWNSGMPMHNQYLSSASKFLYLHAEISFRRNTVSMYYLVN